MTIVLKNLTMIFLNGRNSYKLLEFFTIFLEITKLILFFLFHFRTDKAISQVNYETSHNELLKGNTVLTSAITADDHRQRFFKCFFQKASIY